MECTIHQYLQSANACGYIAARAAMFLHESHNWCYGDILPFLTDDNLIPTYNNWLEINSQFGQELTDEEILLILHKLNRSNKGVDWISGPYSIIQAEIAIQDDLKNNLPIKRVAIINTTRRANFSVELGGDHWITLAYEIY